MTRCVSHLLFAICAIYLLQYRKSTVRTFFVPITDRYVGTYIVSTSYMVRSKCTLHNRRIVFEQVHINSLKTYCKGIAGIQRCSKILEKTFNTYCCCHVPLSTILRNFNLFENCLFSSIVHLPYVSINQSLKIFTIVYGFIKIYS